MVYLGKNGLNNSEKAIYKVIPPENLMLYLNYLSIF